MSDYSTNAKINLEVNEESYNYIIAFINPCTNQPLSYLHTKNHPTRGCSVG